MQGALLRGMAVTALAGLALILSACGGSSAQGSTGNEEASSEPAEFSGEFRALAVDPDDGDLLQVTTSGLFRSPDEGQVWELVSNVDSIDWNAVDGLILNPDDPLTLYTWGAGIGIFRTEDGGQSWDPVDDDLPKSDEIGALALHSNQRDTLYAWIRGQGVFRTEDGTKGWDRMDGGPKSEPVQVLAHTPLEGSMNTGWLYAGTPDGIYLSMDCF